MLKRPRSRKPYFRARDLVDLDGGRPVEEVARFATVGVERVQAWIDGFERLRLVYLAEDSGRPEHSARRSRSEPDDDEA